MNIIFIEIALALYNFDGLCILETKFVAISPDRFGNRENDKSHYWLAKLMSIDVISCRAEVKFSPRNRFFAVNAKIWLCHYIGWRL
jgi:hypothetical protein